MKDKTDQFSFILKPSKIADAGVGVFMTHDISEGTFLDLFASQDKLIEYEKGEIPENFEEFCIVLEDKILGPADFRMMPVGFYMNHSNIPNAYHKNLHWHALRDIKAGEEILIDYNTLGEPEEVKDSYYKIK